VSTSAHTRKRSKSTQRFDPEKLAALAKEAGVEPLAEQPAPEDPAAQAAGAADAAPDAPAVARAKTAEDPITTQVLAEVARTTDEVEFDDTVIDNVVEKLGEGETAHPHTRRRR
jgi:hypothetical protein